MFYKAWGVVAFGLLSTSVGFVLGVISTDRRIARKADEGTLDNYVKEIKDIWGIKEE